MLAMLPSVLLLLLPLLMMDYGIVDEDMMNDDNNGNFHVIHCGHGQMRHALRSFKIQKVGGGFEHLNICGNVIFLNINAFQRERVRTGMVHVPLPGTLNLKKITLQNTSHNTMRTPICTCMDHYLVVEWSSGSPRRILRPLIENCRTPSSVSVES
jgi:hypothetical protein